MTLEFRRRNQAPATAHDFRRPVSYSQEPPQTPAGAEESEGDRRQLTRITVNLTTSAERALTELARSHERSKTDTINRALQLAVILHTLAPGGRLTVQDSNGIPTNIYII